jgi:hypothetical protein
MTSDEFRTLALSMPEAIEASHMGHPDFRVRHSDTKTRIFASLFVPFDDEDGREWAMVKLTSEQQRECCKSNPTIFRPVAGGWGEQGATQIRLDAAGESSKGGRSSNQAIRSAVIAAWRNAAPKRLIEDVPPTRNRKRK